MMAGLLSSFLLGRKSINVESAKVHIQEGFEFLVLLPLKSRRKKVKVESKWIFSK